MIANITRILTRPLKMRRLAIVVYALLLGVLTMEVALLTLLLTALMLP